MRTKTSPKIKVTLLLNAVFSMALVTHAQTNVLQAKEYILKPTPQTVTWGYYDATAKPNLRIKSGDIVHIQTLVACTPPLLMEAGGPAC